jgi:hypothetical protein
MSMVGMLLVRCSTEDTSTCCTECDSPVVRQGGCEWCWLGIWCVDIGL